MIGTVSKNEEWTECSQRERIGQVQALEEERSGGRFIEDMNV